MGKKIIETIDIMGEAIGKDVVRINRIAKIARKQTLKDVLDLIERPNIPIKDLNSLHVSNLADYETGYQEALEDLKKEIKKLGD